MQRIALIYDHLSRADTTGIYCLRAMQRLALVEQFHPERLAEVPRDGFDLFLFIDDGQDYAAPLDLRPQAFWAIDTHVDIERVWQRAQSMDLLFAAQRPGATELSRRSGRTVEWLPLACDPDIHGRIDTETTLDVSFVGNPVTEERVRLVELLERHVPRMYAGQQYFEEMARVYSSSRIVFNKSYGGDINMRVFEALCSGAMLVTDRLQHAGMEELFRDGEHLVTYGSDEELLDKVRFYLRNDAARQKVADAGRACVMENHTYRHRMQRILASSAAGSSVSTPATEFPLLSAKTPPPTKSRGLLDLIPSSAKRIVWIGTDHPEVIGELKLRQQCCVFAITDTSALVRPTCSDSPDRKEQDTATIPSGTFDAVVLDGTIALADDPADALHRVNSCLREEGTLVAIVPNAAHHSLLASLARGNWTAATPGGRSRGAIHLLTRREFEKLLFRTGFRPQEWVNVREDIDKDTASDNSETQAALNRVFAEHFPETHAETFYVAALPTRCKPDGSANDGLSEKLEKLRARFPWPQTRPLVDLLPYPPGWFGDGARLLLAEKLHTLRPRVIVELGSWLGLSTRWLADHAPEATIITIDHFKGSPEHQASKSLSPLLDRLADAFHSACYSYRDRIVVMRSELADGLKEVALLGIRPELIFVDADHGVEQVLQQLALCRALFPEALLVGDDYSNQGVRQAVDEFAGKEGHAVTSAGRECLAWTLPPLRPFWNFPQPIPKAGLTSIVLVTYNELPYTKLCLDSIRRYTQLPYEIIFVDNASSDGTIDFLRQQQDVQLIENTTNRGFPAAVNQAIEVAKGEQVLLLNNDCIVTTGWLNRMLAALFGEADLGLVGPYSNEVSGEQRVAVDYQHLADLDGFAWDWGQRHHQQLLITDRLVGFCLLIKREVIDDIGGLDERFGIGNYDDDDFCRRALAAGYRLAIAEDAFVHHFGGATFKGASIDYVELMEKNRQIYEDKWQVDVKATPQVDSPSSFTLDTSGDGGVLLVSSRPKLSVCMIVRDSSRTLDACLGSIKPYVDEMIVVDTGSIDDTRSIARRHGAKLFEFPWCDDFASARNESLRHATGQWLFWMDSDDTIDPHNGARLRQLVDGPHADAVAAYVMQVHCPHASVDAEDVTAVDHIKLLRNDPRIRFSGRIHEQVLPSINAAKLQVRWTDIFVVHSGSDQSEEGQRRKLERDLRLLKLEELERPEHPFTHFNLGMTYLEMRKFELASLHLKRSLLIAGPQESHVPKGFCMLIQALTELGKKDEAWSRCQLALGRYENDPELLFRAGSLCHDLQRYDDAEGYYLKILNGRFPAAFRSVDRGILGYKVRHNLAVLYSDQQKHELARTTWQGIVECQPGYLPAWKGIIESLLAEHRSGDADSWLARSPIAEKMPRLHQRLRARIAIQRGDITSAKQLLETAASAAPDDSETLDELCRLLFEHGEPHETELALQRLARIRPGDASVQSNLAQICLQLGRHEEAGKLFQHAAALDPARFSPPPNFSGNTHFIRAKDSTHIPVASAPAVHRMPAPSGADASVGILPASPVPAVRLGSNIPVSQPLVCRAFEGLCNRINGIASALATGREVELHWAVNKQCPVRFEEVFQPIPGLTVINEEILSYRYITSRHQLCWFYPRNIEKLPLQEFRQRLYAAYRQVLDALLVTSWAHPTPPAVGLHLRSFLPDSTPVDTFARDAIDHIQRLGARSAHLATDHFESGQKAILLLQAAGIDVSFNAGTRSKHDLDRSHDGIMTMCADLRSLSECKQGILVNSCRSTVADVLRGHGIAGITTFAGGREAGLDDLFELQSLEEQN